MAEATEVLTAQDIAEMDLDELKRSTKPIEVDAKDITFPAFEHHMTVRGKLEALVRKDVITFDEFEEVYDRWRESKQ